MAITFIHSFSFKSSIAYEEKKMLCAEYGFKGLSPFDGETDAAHLPKRKAGLQIGKNNETLRRSSSIVIANLTPFRGSSADVGTVYECGFASAIGRIIFGYTHSKEPFAERTTAWLKGSVNQDRNGHHRDANGMIIEDFDLPDNLVISTGIESTGGKVIIAHVPKSQWYTNLSAFELCLKEARGKIWHPST